MHQGRTRSAADHRSRPAWPGAVTLVLALLALLVSACSSGPGATPPAARPTGTTPPIGQVLSDQAKQQAAQARPARLAKVKGIVDPTNLGWPRQVDALNGRVTIAAKPQRILTLSLGHDEVTYALVPAQRVVGVGEFTKYPDYSNVADLAAALPTITRDPEVVAAQRPDLVVVSPFSSADTVAALKKLGLTVLQTELRNEAEGRLDDVLLLGYAYGEEERAFAFSAEVLARYQALIATTQRPGRSRPRVLSLNSFGDKLYTAGKGSTEGAIIEAAGGLNAAAQFGLMHNPTISIEGIVAMAPDVIIIPQPPGRSDYGLGGEEFKQDLLKNPALASVPAVKRARISIVPPRWFTTLSFWNIRGSEELAKVLWPEEFGGKQFPGFSTPART